MRFTKVISLLNKKPLSWKRIDDAVCVHTFVKDYYINLCKYRTNNGSIGIQLDVDNIKKNQSDIIKETYLEGSVEYTSLSKIYSVAIEKAEVHSYA